MGEGERGKGGGEKEGGRREEGRQQEGGGGVRAPEDRSWIAHGPSLASASCTRGSGTIGISPSPGSANTWEEQRSNQQSSSSTREGSLPGPHATGNVMLRGTREGLTTECDVKDRGIQREM